MWRAGVLLAVLMPGLWACGEALEKEESVSPSARWDIVESLRADREAARHPADGGGRVWIEGGSGSAALAGTVSRAGTWSFVFETGPEGIADGGWLFFQAPPFWGWSSPQAVEPGLPGFTVVSTEVEGIELETQAFENELFGIKILGRALSSGDQIRIVYGAGERGAVADRFAEHRSEFFFAVDGDGDGYRSLLEEAPWIDIGPGPASQVVVSLPSSARPEETARLTVAVLDARGNSGLEVSGDFALTVSGGTLDLPSLVSLSEEDRGVLVLEFPVQEEGIYRVAY